MKKLLTLLLAMALTTCLASCGSEEKTNAEATPDTKAPAVDSATYKGPTFSTTSSMAVKALSETAAERGYENVMGTEPTITDKDLSNGAVTFYTYVSQSGIAFNFIDAKDSGKLCEVQVMAASKDLKESDYETLDKHIITLAYMFSGGDDLSRIVTDLHLEDIDYSDMETVHSYFYESPIASYMLNISQGNLTFTIDPK